MATERGVILAGGKGARLGELRRVANKHLLPVGALPMVYYPLKKLVGAGVREVLLVSGTEHVGGFVALLGSGSQMGVELDGEGRLVGIEEKPKQPKSEFAVAGVYVYPPDVFAFARTFAPSARGELEITGVNNHYLRQGRLGHTVLEGYWTDAGTHESLALANRLVAEQPPLF